MGVDARMLIVVPKEPSEDEVRLWSVRIAREIGTEHFSQNRKTGRGAIELTKDWRDEVAQSGKIYYQDGDDIIAKGEETFLEVSLVTRYYGPGYERGNWMVICACAEWIEANIPSAKVFYGGDSSGVCAEPFDNAARYALKAHAYGVHSRDYFNYDAHRPEHHQPKPNLADCKLCVKEYYSPTRYGWGGSGETEYAAYHCAVCGEYFNTRNGGQTWKLGKEML